MRTRFLNKMTNDEVEAYLKRNDILFIPIGTSEPHGYFPADMETTLPEAIAYDLAEKCDGLVLGGLSYFFCGATTEAKVSVQMSLRAGREYVKRLSYSLLAQGFRRQVYVGVHGPAYLTAGAVIMDMFDETKVPMAYMEPLRINLLDLKDFEVNGRLKHHKMICGAYRLLGRLDELVIDPSIPDEYSFLADRHFIDDETDEYKYLFKFGPLSGATGFYQRSAENHGGFFGGFRSMEERDLIAEEGEKLLREMTARLDIQKYVQCMRELDELVNGLIKANYSHLPKAPFSEWA